MRSREERELVADKLRELGETDSFAGEVLDRDSGYDSLVLRAIRATVGPGDVFEVLADLIDPSGLDRPETRLVEDEDGNTNCEACGCTALCLAGSSFYPVCGGRIVGRAWDD